MDYYIGISELFPKYEFLIKHVDNNYIMKVRNRLPPEIFKEEFQSLQDIESYKISIIKKMDYTDTYIGTSILYPGIKFIVNNNNQVIAVPDLDNKYFNNFNYISSEDMKKLYIMIPKPEYLTELQQKLKNDYDGTEVGVSQLFPGYTFLIYHTKDNIKLYILTQFHLEYIYGSNNSNKKY